MKIAIISLGGESSQAVAFACQKFFKKVDMLNLREFELMITKEGVSVVYEKKDVEKYDCIYLRGSYKYSLLQRAIARTFSKAAYIPARTESFDIAHDKFLTLLELQKKKVEVPKTYYAASAKLVKKILENEVRYPIIMKLSKGTHGKGVMVADSKKSAFTILDMLEDFKQPFIIQEFVKTIKTTDIRAIVVGNSVVAAYQRKAAKWEMRSNIHSGGKRIQHEMTKEQEKLAINSAKAIGADICGVDLLNAEKPSVIEVNISPSIIGAVEITGKNIPNKIAKFLYRRTLEFKENKKKVKNKRKQQ